MTKNDLKYEAVYFQYENKTLRLNGSIRRPLAVSLSCNINTGKNQSDCTNCLKCLRMYINHYKTKKCWHRNNISGDKPKKQRPLNAIIIVPENQNLLNETVQTMQEIFDFVTHGRE